MAKYHWKGRTKQNQFKYKTEEILRTSHDPRNLAAPESGRPGGNTLIAKMNRGSLAAAVAVYKGYSVDQPPKKTMTPGFLSIPDLHEP